MCGNAVASWCGYIFYVSIIEEELYIYISMLTLHSVLSLPIPVLCTVIRYLVVVHWRRNDYEKENHVRIEICDYDRSIDRNLKISTLSRRMQELHHFKSYPPIFATFAASSFVIHVSLCTTVPCFGVFEFDIYHSCSVSSTIYHSEMTCVGCCFIITIPTV